MSFVEKGQSGDKELKSFSPLGMTREIEALGTFHGPEENSTEPWGWRGRSLKLPNLGSCCPLVA